MLEIARHAALEAGKILTKHWGKKTHIAQKSASIDLVTEVDKESEACILKILQRETPHLSILSEEAGMSKGDETETLWVVDPLDGTTNYAHNFPVVSISIALVQNKKPIVGIVYNPIHNEFFEAELGKGAFLNGERLAVSRIHTLDSSLLCSGFPYDRRENPDNNYGEFCLLTQLTQGVRRAGSAALDLAYVAAGRLDGYWERGLKPWDIAAGTLLVEEAGGRVTTYDLAPFDLYGDKILASNNLIHSTLSQQLLSAHRINSLHFN